jgi:hypothetical protein
MQNWRTRGHAPVQACSRCIASHHSTITLCLHRLTNERPRSPPMNVIQVGFSTGRMRRCKTVLYMQSFEAKCEPDWTLGALRSVPSRPSTALFYRRPYSIATHYYKHHSMEYHSPENSAAEVRIARRGRRRRRLRRTARPGQRPSGPEWHRPRHVPARHQAAGVPGIAARARRRRRRRRRQMVMYRRDESVCSRAPPV